MSDRGDFYRFPHTPHLTWLSPGSPRGDKILTQDEVERFVTNDVVVEEKVDGANVGLSVDASGVLRAQNRGAYIEPGAHPQFGPLRAWMAERQQRLIDALGEDLILFGEWCFAVHSVEYAALPDWFLAFDVFERSTKRFWSTERRDALCREVGATVVPALARGRFPLDELVGMIGRSRLGADHSEGVYVRLDVGPYLEGRAKIVRAEFVQAIGEHWSARQMRMNQLAERQG